MIQTKKLVGLADAREILLRTCRVRCAKRRKMRESARDNLSPEDLDLILPPVECLRTRLRRSGSPYRAYSERKGGGQC